MELMHGGHLGFFEGGFMYPNPIAWLDRTLVSLLPALKEHCIDDVKKTAVCWKISSSVNNITHIFCALNNY